MFLILTSICAVLLGDLHKVSANPSQVQGSHPFVGENADQSIVERSDGTGFAMRLSHVNGNVDKYKAFVNTSMVIKGLDDVSLFDLWWNSIFPSYDSFGSDSFGQRRHQNQQRS